MCSINNQNRWNNYCVQYILFWCCVAQGWVMLVWKNGILQVAIRLRTFSPPYVLLILLTYNVLNMCSMILVVYWLYSIKPQTGYTHVSEPNWFPVFCSTGNFPHPFVFKVEKYNWNFAHPDQDQSIINLLSVKWRFYCRFL